MQRKLLSAAFFYSFVGACPTINLQHGKRVVLNAKGADRNLIFLGRAWPSVPHHFE